MGALLRPSDPPPPERAKTLHRAWITPLPKLRIQNTNRERGRRTAAELTDLKLKARGTSDVELAEALCVSRSLITGWRDASEGIQLGDLIALANVGAHRDALEILDRVRHHILSRIDSHGE